MKKVLVVEDELSLYDLISEKLKEGGFEVEGAHDGQEAVDYFANGGTADLVLLDFMLPKLDGIAVMKQYQELGVKAPVVILSNFPDKEDEFRQLGATAFVVKAEFSPGVILTKVNEVIKK